MEDKIFEILGNYGLPLDEKQEIAKKLLILFSVNNCEDNSDEKEWTCPDHTPYRGACSTCGCY